MAYINGDLNEQIFMKQPKRFVEEGKEDYVCLLKKSLYGLKQSGRQWFRKLSSILLEIGMVQCQADPCVYFKRTGEKIVLLAAYVDDLIAVSNDDELLRLLKTELSLQLKIKDLGELSHCLGLEISTKRRFKRHYVAAKIHH